MRVDGEATVTAGVWRSATMLPLTYLAATLNSSTSGSVFLWWQQPVKATPWPPPDALVMQGKPIVLQPDLERLAWLYAADSAGGAFDMVYAGDTESVDPLAGTPVVGVSTAQPLPVVTAGGLTLTTGQLAVTAAAQLVKAANLSRYSMVITNTGATTVFLGPSAAVTIATGQALLAGNSITFATTSAIFAIAAAVGDTISWAEEAI